MISFSFQIGGQDLIAEGPARRVLLVVRVMPIARDGD
jgi:hypothetical protein